MGTVERIDSGQALKELLGFMTLMLRPAHDRESAQFQAYCQAYIETIEALRCKPETLRQAAYHLKTAWTKTGWPTTGELARILREIEPSDRTPPDRPERLDRSDISPEQKTRISKRAKRLKNVQASGLIHSLDPDVPRLFHDAQGRCIGCPGIEELPELDAYVKHGRLPDRLQGAEWESRDNGRETDVWAADD